MYENEIENERTNVDEVSVLVTEISKEKPTSAKKNTTTVTIHQ